MRCFHHRQWMCLPEGCSAIHTNVRMHGKTSSVKGFTRDGGVITAQLGDTAVKSCSSTCGDLSWLEQLPAIWVSPARVRSLYLHACYLTEQVSPEQPATLMSPNCTGFVCFLLCKSDFAIQVRRLFCKPVSDLGFGRRHCGLAWSGSPVQWCYWSAAWFSTLMEMCPLHGLDCSVAQPTEWGSRHCISLPYIFKQEWGFVCITKLSKFRETRRLLHNWWEHFSRVISALCSHADIHPDAHPD